MRLLMLLLFGAVVLGVIYHTRIEQYVTGVFESPPASGGSFALVGGAQSVGRADNALMTGAAHALQR